MWISIKAQLPEFGVPVIGFNPKWIDEDFNENGIRECFRTGDGTNWYSAYWFDHQDTYENHEEAPTHWRYYPKPPQEQFWIDL